ncbi:MAG: hypothetical protein AAF690_27870 [Acidobacteriota bacterium]
MRSTLLRIASGVGCLFAVSAAAHTPLLDCYKNDDGTITCEGGFSDGASAAGVEIRIIDEIDRVVLKGKLDDDAQFTFEEPDFDYHVIFDAGSNHVVVLFGGEIE